jgi:hypothetical protein
MLNWQVEAFLAEDSSRMMIAEIGFTGEERISL